VKGRNEPRPFLITRLRLARRFVAAVEALARNAEGKPTVRLEDNAIKN